MKLVDVEFAKIIAWLKANRLQASTDRKGATTIRPRLPKKSRLTGERR